MPSNTESLRAAERRLQSAQLASDVTALDELIDDAAWFTGPDGKLYTKQDDLTAHETGHQVLSRLDEEDLRVMATAHTGVTWFLGTLEGAVGGQPVAARLRYTRTWTRDEQTDWKIIAAHATFLPEA
ncbi:nuclear transport factor 2 family protein [Actinokineospora xionganensis]|uniref:Nuclear transport factor 2 family protein n=1 Tax=Actinokineospora xionganensis TaxID=2684470 RepID=A0ABR7L9Z1_9PSEU|nr:nuclear transport factor 2 family protein [Actinokineospora xionganensis]MBC6449530.1 nuclear transport factor 2 family protein [Actinokineospora xionganensis]